MCDCIYLLCPGKCQGCNGHASKFLSQTEIITCGVCYLHYNNKTDLKIINKYGTTKCMCCCGNLSETIETFKILVCATCKNSFDNKRNK